MSISYVQLDVYLFLVKCKSFTNITRKHKNEDFMSVSLCFRGAFLYCDESKFELPGTLTTAYNLRMCLLALLMIVTVSYSILFPFSSYPSGIPISYGLLSIQLPLTPASVENSNILNSCCSSLLLNSRPSPGT